jgi:putative selenium metabolism hydrolase
MKALDFDECKTDRYGNVLGRVGEGGKVILFDSHMDTVNVTDEESWDVPPFSGEIVDGYLYGRGSVDMKSGLAASIYAAAIAKSQGLLAGKTIYVSCTVFEEDCDGEGLKHLLETCNLHPDFAVICEPSANTISLGHKGKAQIIIRTEGISAHGSAPEVAQSYTKRNHPTSRTNQPQADAKGGQERQPGVIADFKHCCIFKRSAL